MMLVKLSPVTPSTLLDEDFHMELGEGAETYEGVDLPCYQTCKLECGHHQIYPFRMLHEWVY